jgi:uncharacterized membrane protein YgaE (UPF0421/DUF939 family)
LKGEEMRIFFLFNSKYLLSQNQGTRSAKTGQANRNRTTVQTKVQGRRDPASSTQRAKTTLQQEKQKQTPLTKTKTAANNNNHATENSSTTKLQQKVH